MKSEEAKELIERGVRELTEALAAGKSDTFVGRQTLWGEPSTGQHRSQTSKRRRRHRKVGRGGTGLCG